MAPAFSIWGPSKASAHLAIDRHATGFSSLRQTVADLLRTGRVPLQFANQVVLSIVPPVFPGIRAFRLLPPIGTGWSATQAGLLGDQTGPEAIQAFKIIAGSVAKQYPALFSPTPSTSVQSSKAPDWRTRVERAPLPFTSSIVSDPGVLKGSKVLRQFGAPGLRQRTLRVLYVNGHQESMVSMPWLMVKAPTPRIIAVGTRAMIASRGEFAGREVIMLDATAYYPGPRNFGGGVGPRTAIGIVAQRGVVAVDPAIIPLGSKLFIEGYGYAVAGDTGGAIQGMRIDLCYNSYDEAIHFGRQHVKVYILGRH